MSDLTSYFVNDPSRLAWLAAGFALGHLHNIVFYLMHFVLSVPWIRGLILSNPERAKSIMAQIEKEMEQAIDAESKKKEVQL